MVRIALLTLACGVSIAAAQQLPSPPPEVAPGLVTADRYPAPLVTFPNGVRGIPELVYREPVGYRPLTLDLYLPPDSMKTPAGGFPLVLYIHGGAWIGGDTRHSGPFVDFPGVLAALAARGYVVASIGYRLSGEAKFPAQAQDVKAAIRRLRLDAPQYRIDPARSITWGVSAGGHLAALAAVSCGAAALEPKRDAEPGRPGAPDTPDTPDTRSNPIATVSDCVQGCVSWYGVFDLATITAQAAKSGALSRTDPEAPEWQLLGCFGETCAPGQIAAASPVTYVDSGDPPMLLIVGSEDTTVPPEQTMEMADKLKAAGVKNELLVLPGLNHDFIGHTPEQTREANLSALAATFQFIDQTIGKRPPCANCAKGERGRPGR